MNPSQVPAGWTLTRLGDLHGKAPGSLVGGPFGSDLTSSDYQAEPGVPVIRGSNLGGNTGEFIDDGFVFVSVAKADSLSRNSASPGDIIFTQRGTLGQIALIPKDARFPRYIVSQSQMRMTPDIERVDRRFLLRYFRSPKALSRIAARALTTGVPHINLGILRDFPVELPPFPEQQRIATVLDRADALRAKRRAALVQLDTLTQSIFLEMFGDPAKNPKGWPRKLISEVSTVITGNTPPRSVAAYYGTDIEWIKSDNINTPHSYLTRADEGLSPLGKAVARTVPAGSILVTCIAGSPDCIGNAALTDREVAFNQQINALVPEGCDSLFLYVQILAGKRLIQEASTSGMKGMVSKSRFEKISLIFPPLALQRIFAKCVVAIEEMKANQGASFAALDALFSSLQHRAFRGEL